MNHLDEEKKREASYKLAARNVANAVRAELARREGGRYVDASDNNALVVIVAGDSPDAPRRATLSVNVRNRWGMGGNTISVGATGYGGRAVGTRTFRWDPVKGSKEAIDRAPKFVDALIEVHQALAERHAAAISKEQERDAIHERVLAACRAKGRTYRGSLGHEHVQSTPGVRVRTDATERVAVEIGVTYYVDPEAVPDALARIEAVLGDMDERCRGLDGVVQRDPPVVNR